MHHLVQPKKLLLYLCIPIPIFWLAHKLRFVSLDWIKIVQISCLVSEALLFKFLHKVRIFTRTHALFLKQIVERAYLCRMKNQWNNSNFVIGMLGGGQLGRMFIQEALNYDAHIHCLDPNPKAPCSKMATEFSVGSLTDYDTVVAFGKNKDVVTIEIEHVNVEALETLESNGVKVFPQPRVIRIVQDKGLQKEFYATNNFPTAPFKLFSGKNELLKSNQAFPYVLKWRTGGYDGKGVKIMKSALDFDELDDVPFLVEELIPFSKELSVIVARNETGESNAYPAVECEFNPTLNLVEFLFSPANIEAHIEEVAKQLAMQIIEKLDMIGILAVEFFLTENNELLVNEIAPRPHNSGHHTIECCYTSQFEQHFRSIVNAPLGSTELITPGVMINLLGEAGYSGIAKYENLDEVMKIKGVSVHLYGKKETKPFRKMGHVTIYGENLAELKKIGKDVAQKLKIIA